MVERVIDLRGNQPDLSPPSLVAQTITTAPASAGSFFDPWVTTNQEYNRQICDLAVTPTDEVTGLPYCFAPNPRVEELLRTPDRHPQALEKQHQFPKVEVLQSANPLVTDDIKQVLLNMRWQTVTYWDHHYGYNPHYVGPRQPTNHLQLGTMAIMNLAGYIPAMALDFSGQSPLIRELSPAERRHLWTSGQVRVGSEPDVRRYLFKYVFAQATDHIRSSEIDEFMHTYDYDRKRYLGHCLTAKMVERAVEPVETPYAQARQAGLLALRDKQGCRPVPNNPRDLVKAELAAKHRFGEVLSHLHQKLGPNPYPDLLSDVA